MHTVVTSWTDKGYELYGKSFVETFSLWPSSVSLVVYWEGVPQDLGPRVQVSSILDVDRWPAQEKRLRAFPLMTGKVGDKYNINYDGLMQRKAFIQAHAVSQFGGKIFWIDADTITHSPVPEGFLDEMLPGGKLNCFLGRDGWYYTESGFLGFDGAHPGCDKFIRAYIGVFETGAIFTQPGWHDCYGFDLVRKQAPAEWFHDLAAEVPRGCMHPFVNSRLGAVMDHRKGPRKNGRSGGSDLVVKRTEPYWNAVS